MMFCSGNEGHKSKPLPKWPTTEAVLESTRKDMSIPPSEQTVFITGANTGIGKAAALALAKEGYHVIIGSRNVDRGNEVREAIEAEGGKAFVQPIDLGAMENVKRAASEVLEQISERGYPPLYVLVLNAGIFPFAATYADDTKCENTFQINHLGHFLLCKLLLPDLRKRAGGSNDADKMARVVIVSSGSHYGPLNTKDVESKDALMEKVVYSKKAGFGSYGSSKLCNVLMASKLHRSEHSVVAASLHPGAMIGTDIARKGNFLFRWSFRLINLFTKSVDQGAATTVFLSTCKQSLMKGQYFDDCKPCAKSTLATEAAEDLLWEISESIVEPYV